MSSRTHLDLGDALNYFDGILFAGHIDLIPAWKVFGRDYLQENTKNHHLRQLELLNEFVFKILGNVSAEISRSEANAILGQLQTFVEGYPGNLEHLHSDIIEPIVVNAKRNVGSELNKAIVANLVRGWHVLKIALAAPPVPGVLTRDGPQWQAYEEIAVTPEGSLILNAALAATDVVIQAQSAAAVRHLSNANIDQSKVYLLGQREWYSAFFRYQIQPDATFLTYLSNRLGGTIGRGSLISYSRRQHDDFADSLDAPIADDADKSFLDDTHDAAAPNPFGELATSDTIEVINAAIDECLEERDARIVRLHIGLNKERHVYNNEEIGKIIGVSRERVRQLLEIALPKLRKHLSRLDDINEVPMGAAQKSDADIPLPEQIASGCRFIARNNPNRGYFGDALPHIMRLLELDKNELSLKTGIYPSYIDAYLNGEIVPSAAALSALKTAINPDNYSGLNQAIDALLVLDNKRIKERYRDNSNRLTVVTALGAVTKTMHLHHFMDAILNKSQTDLTGIHYQNLLGINPATNIVTLRNMYYRSNQHEGQERYNFSSRQRSADIVRDFAKGVARFVGDKEGLYATLIEDFALQKHVKEPFKRVFAEYLKSGGDLSILGLFEFAAEKWECVLKDVGIELKIDWDDYQINREAIEKFGVTFLHDLAIRNDLSPEQTDDLIAIRKGTYGVCSVESLADDARAILNDPEPTYIKFANNPIVVQMKQAMPHLAELKDGQPIPKNLVPNALLGCLIDRTTKAAFEVFSSIGKPNSFVGEVIRGEREFLVIRKKNTVPEHQANIALDTAKFYSEDARIIEKLALAFIEIGTKREPDDLMEAVKTKELRIGEMARICRLQAYQTRPMIAKAISPIGSPHSHAVVMLESEDKPMSPAMAKSLADRCYKAYPKAKSKGDFTSAVSGRLVDAAEMEEKKKVLLTTIETAVEAGYTDFGKEGAPKFASILPSIRELCGDGGLASFNVTLQRFCGKVARTAFYQWSDPAHRVQKPQHAEGIADMLIHYGMRSDLRHKLICLAQQSITADLGHDTLPVSKKSR